MTHKISALVAGAGALLSAMTPAASQTTAPPNPGTSNATSTAAPGQPACVPGGTWAYTGSAKGKPAITDLGKATLIEFAPAGRGAPDSVIFSSVNPADTGTYQVNADVDVNHLGSDAVFDVTGATSAAVGRPFEVTMGAGDGGSSGFSRPINTTGPFTITLKTQPSGKISIKIRNFVVCKLR